jgi:multidrug resistance efflux pump
MENPATVRARTVLGLVGLCVLASGLSPSTPGTLDCSGLPRAPVLRTDLATTVLAPGRVESSVHTVIRCQLENLRGRRGPDGRRASAAIVSLVAEGQRVQAGDVLCRLDTSEHEELALLQRITVARARAEHRRAQLDLETAEIGLREFRDGLCRLRTRELEGSIKLAEADVDRLTDRLAWSRRIFAKGYISKARLADERAALERAEVNLQRLRNELGCFKRFQAARTRRELDCAVDAARTTLTFQSLDLRTEAARLAQLEEQIAAALIRAPHDGQVILAHRPRRNVTIEEGLWVRQNQPIMYLPDCTKLEVHVELHETVVDRVRPGMRVRVRLEGSDRSLIGELASIDPLPLTDPNSRIDLDVKSFLGQVRLAEVPPALRLGMPVQVEIETAVREGALVVPPQAIGGDGEDPFCLVAAGRRLARRKVALGAATPVLQEVTAGVQEGDEVLLLGPRGTGLAPDGPGSVVVQ